MVIGGGTCTVASALQMGGNFSSATWPMNFRVMCRFSGGTQRGLESVRRSSPSSAANVSRTSAESCRATKRRISGTRRRRLAVVEKMQANHIEGGLRGLHANHFAVARKTRGAFANAGGASYSDVHSADGFFFAAASGSGDACD